MRTGYEKQLSVRLHYCHLQLLVLEYITALYIAVHAQPAGGTTPAKQS